MPFMRVMEAGIETRSEWIRLLRKHVGMTVARGFGWIVSIFLVALIGDGGFRWIDELDTELSSQGTAGTWPARLVLHRTSGRPREAQVNVETRPVVRWGGSGSMIPGRAWIQGDGLAWAPAARLARDGCARIAFPH
jgi:hypothetical protein